MKDGNIQKVKKFFSISLELGDAVSTRKLRDIYEQEGSIWEARKLYEKGSNLGNEKAKRNIERLGGKGPINAFFFKYRNNLF